MNKVSMTLTSEISVDDLEEILESLKPVIRMIGCIEIHTEILAEDEEEKEVRGIEQDDKG